MSIPPGTRVGRYEIRSLLGAGGMGVVYLAHDAHLGRNVALKMLPAGLVESTDRVQRFMREARAASALNHPYILTVHEIGTAGDVHYIAMEFVEGVTLRVKLHEERIDLGKSLEFLTQVAEGLVKAHAAGIVHRDLKPDNIMVTRDGFAKILDFGLAKLIEGGAHNGADSVGEAATRMHQSTSGMIMGTAGYMSPEQAQGAAVDARSDIFSFGCILYEAAAGRQPFAADSVVDTLHNIIHASPAPVRDVNPAASAELERIIRKCLAKDPEERYQTIKDVAIDLKALRRDSDVIQRPAPRTVATAETRPSSSAEYLVQQARRHKRSAVLILSVVAIVLLAAAFGVWTLLDQRERRSAPPPQMKVTRLISTGNVTRAVVSPDGRYAVHVVEEMGKQGLWMRQIATGSNVNVLPLAQVTYLGLTFSQDGNYVYYVRREAAGAKGVVYQMPTLGQSSRKVLEGADGAVTLSPDGRQLAFVRRDFSRGESALIVANIDGTGERTVVTRKEPEGFETEGPAWSPDGKVIACSGYSATASDSVGLVAVDIESGREKPILPAGLGSILKIAWLQDGSGLLMSAADKSSGYFYQIWHVAYPGGDLRRITNDLNSYSDVSLTADSKTLVTVQGDWISNLWVSPDGTESRAQRITSGKYDGGMGVAWTPDGRIVQASRDWDISILDADGSNQRLLTPDEHNNRWVSVTPDGRYILFESWRKSVGIAGIWRMDIDGGNPRQITTRGWASAPDPSPDGKWVVYESYASGIMSIWKTSIDGGEETQLTQKNTDEPVISPDGKLVACFYYTGQSIRLAVIPFEGGEAVYEFDLDPGIRDKTPAWTPDGRAITYIVNRGGVSNIWSQPLGGGKPVQLTDFKSDLIFAFDWSPDGRLVLSRGTTPNDVVLISGFR